MNVETPLEKLKRLSSTKALKEFKGDVILAEAQDILKLDLEQNIVKNKLAALQEGLAIASVLTGRTIAPVEDLFNLLLKYVSQINGKKDSS